MKKLSFLMLCLVVLAAACKKDNPVATPIKFSLDATTVSTTERAGTQDISTKIHITNTDTKTITFRWRRVPQTVPGSWILSTCTFGSCYAPAIDTETIILAKDSTVEVKQNFNPMNATGTGATKILFYDPTDSAATVKEATFTVTAN